MFLRLLSFSYFALRAKAESFAAVLEQGSVAKEQALEEQREKLAAEARERLAELEVRLKEAEEAAAAYARLSETVKQSVEALKEEAEQNAKELATYFETVAKDTVERERGERVAVLRDLAVRLELLEKHRMDNIESAKKVAGLQKLHGAVNALAVALREHAGRPFTAELSVLKKLAADNPIVDTCVDMIGNLAAEGVPSDFELERWFVQGVKGAALRAGRMEGDGGIASYVLAGIAAYAPFVIGGARTPTDEVIERAEKHLRDGDVEGAAREVNQLQGWAKVAAKDWLEAARGKVKANYVLDVSIQRSRQRSIYGIFVSVTKRLIQICTLPQLLQAELMVILSEIG